MAGSIPRIPLNKLTMVLGDAIGAGTAVWLAYMIRFDSQIWPYYVGQLSNFVVIFLLVRLTSLYYLGLYRGIWRYFSLDDTIALVKAVSLGTTIVVVIDYFRNYGIGMTIAGLFSLSAIVHRFTRRSHHGSSSHNRARRFVLGGLLFLSLLVLVGAIWIFRGTEYTRTSPLTQTWMGQHLLARDFPYDLGIPRSVIVVEWIVCLFLVGSFHLAPRLLADGVGRYRQKRSRKVLVVGAGDSGEMVVREMRRNPGCGYLPVGFVDDSVFKRNARIHGLEVLGSMHDIADIVRNRAVDEILIAIPSLQGPLLRELLTQCRQANLPVRTLPGISSMISGRFGISNLQPLDASFLLGRDEIRLDLEPAAQHLHGKRVMVTGAGGSIGSELCRQIATYGPESLIMLGKGENSIYEIERELLTQYDPKMLETVIADIRDIDKLQHTFGSCCPDVVFHAAAHKHVPLMEKHPDEAIRNNVFGTLNLARAACQNRVSLFVMISTDKAVNPTSVMGATKGVAELIVQDFARKGSTKFVTVRFGNVIRSRGSVIPLFEDQIRNGGPVTVTHPEVTRYFMSIPEAVHLVLQSGTAAESGDICVLDMGEPVKIVDLARNLIRLAGLRPDEDIQIEFTGLRPGEKLFEEILVCDQGMQATKHDKIFLDAADQVDSDKLRANLEELGTCVRTHNRDAIISLLRRIVPTYTPQKHESKETRLRSRFASSE